MELETGQTLGIGSWLTVCGLFVPQDARNLPVRLAVIRAGRECYDALGLLSTRFGNRADTVTGVLPKYNLLGRLSPLATTSHTLIQSAVSGSCVLGVTQWLRGRIQENSSDDAEVDQKGCPRFVYRFHLLNVCATRDLIPQTQSGRSTCSCPKSFKMRVATSGCVGSLSSRP
jgi:hypothetical protein